MANNKPNVQTQDRKVQPMFDHLSTDELEEMALKQQDRNTEVRNQSDKMGIAMRTIRNQMQRHSDKRNDKVMKNALKEMREAVDSLEELCA
jgi:hypothetical protein